MEQKERRIVTFSVGKGQYGIDVYQVKEVVSCKECTTIPKVPSFIEGLMNLRGQVILVINLREFLEISSEKPKNNSMKTVMVIDAPGRNLGFLVDEVFGVTRISEEEIEASPIPSQNMITGVFKRDENVVMVIDAYKLIEMLERIMETRKIQPKMKAEEVK